MATNRDWPYGLNSKHILIRSAERLERHLLLALLALLLALLFGTETRYLDLDRGSPANTVQNGAIHSDFTLGLYYALREHWSRQFVLEMFYTEGTDVGPHTEGTHQDADPLNCSMKRGQTAACLLLRDESLF